MNRLVRSAAPRSDDEVPEEHPACPPHRTTCRSSGWPSSATPSWARSTPTPGAASTTSAPRASAPGAGRWPGATCPRAGRRRPVRLGRGRRRLARGHRRATTSTSSTSSPPATPTPRSPSPRSRPASTSSARSRWPRRSRRRERMTAAAQAAAAQRRPQHGGVQLPPGPRDRARPPARRRPAASARSARSARCTCRTGSSTPTSRSPGACRRTAPAPGALGDIGSHIIDAAQFITGQRLTRGLRHRRDLRQEAPAGGRPHRREHRAWARRPPPSAARSPSTTRPCSSAAATAARS